MEFFCFHRDRPGSLPLRRELLAAHWAYMDRFADGMIARGPTYAADGETPTGSVHVLDLPGPAAARAFAFDEPGYQAGVYRDVLLRRWQNSLGRTMWDYGENGATTKNRFLVLGFTSEPASGTAEPLPDEDLIAFGPLLSDNGRQVLGAAALLQAPDPGTARSALSPDRYDGVEVHHWRFGGRP